MAERDTGISDAQMELGGGQRDAREGKLFKLVMSDGSGVSQGSPIEVETPIFTPKRHLDAATRELGREGLKAFSRALIDSVPPSGIARRERSRSVSPHPKHYTGSN